MTMRFFIASLLAGLAFMPAATFACSCMPTPDVATSYRDASAVFLGRVISITTRPGTEADGKPTWRWVSEEAEFVVEKSWKNAKVGEVVQFKTPELGGGRCSQSAHPYVTDPSHGPPTGRWIIYAYAGPPYQISGCSRSQPANTPSADIDERALDALVEK